MKKTAAPQGSEAEEIPEHLLNDLRNQDLIGLGNSRHPSNSVWLGEDYDSWDALSLDRDPEDALAQIVEAILVSRNPQLTPRECADRVDIVTSQIFGKQRKRGPKDDWGRVDKHEIYRAAAKIYNERYSNSPLSKVDWKSCLWNALDTDKQHKMIEGEKNGDSFINFYNEFRKWLAIGNTKSRLLFKVSEYDEDKGIIPEDWQKRQGYIDRIINDLNVLGVIIEPQAETTK